MQRISTLLQKINELASKDKEAGVIDIDLMMDYTRVLYADLQEWRARVSFNTSLHMQPPTPVAAEPEREIAPAPPPSQPGIIAQPPAPPKETLEEKEPPKLQAITLSQTEQSHQYDVRKYISINDKYQFISELFGNDKEAYENVIMKVNQSVNYEDAISQLDEIHTERHWNDDDITVQSFYGILSQFFSER